MPFHSRRIYLVDFAFSRFRAFGPLRYARITIDQATSRSRGTGFACFWNLEDADKVVVQSELLKLETTGTPSAVVCAEPILGFSKFSDMQFNDHTADQEESVFDAFDLDA